MHRIAFAAAVFIALGSVVYLTVGPGARAAGTNPDAMSVDMDPAAAPANTATSLGSREACARINENNTLDADEDTTADTVTFDVTVSNIPASNPMIAFSYMLNYDESKLTLQSADENYLIVATQGSSLLDGSEPRPDTDGNNTWTATAVDTNADAPESGSGVLTRATISTDTGATAGEYPLTITFAGVIDPSTEGRPPDAINNGSIAVGQACAGETPTPTSTAGTPTPTPTPSGGPTPSPTPTPTPVVTPTPSATPVVSATPSPSPAPHLMGDVDCNGSVVATDSLKVLRHIASLTVVQTEPCDNIGTGGPPPQGDVDCNGSVVATDSLKILRFVAGLTVIQTEPCDNIGTPIGTG